MIARSLPDRRPPSHGYTLVELLCVLGIITIFLALIKPAVTSLTRGQTFTGNVYDVDYLVRQAKATAMAQNTFVWVGFQSTTYNGSAALVVTTVVSRNGLSAAVPSNASPTPTPTATPTSTPYEMISKPMILQNMQLDSTGSLGQTPATYKNLAGFDSTYNVDIGGSAYSFAQSVPGITGAITFTAVVAFSPDGAANLGTTAAARTIGIGLKVAPASVANPQVAAVQISGLNGRSTIFRQ